ncbi:forkhead box protein R2 [Carlito syrichta]|uniref:Forkhead box protein R2 n=1 Tax=Carlito syrichta TaxID=1868482 RepID=A0A1U7T3B4_CARSF|nr:forkhead box protein R2 [Carlito syrichta]
MDMNLKDREFWYSLHGQVPGLLDWDMENEFFLTCTTDQLPLAEQNLVKYRMQTMKHPEVPQEKRPSPDNDGPQCEPNLWMWVNPNIVCPHGSQKAPEPSKKKALTRMLPSLLPPLKTEEFSSSEATVVDSLPSSSSEQSPLQKLVTPSSSDFNLTEEVARKQENNSSVDLQSHNTRKHFQSQKLSQVKVQKRKTWLRPPLNYSHLIVLALKNSPHCGLNVQEIYSFIRQHFPYFRTASDGWKSTLRHDLCFLGSFKKLPVCSEDGATTRRPRACLWGLTEEGHNRFWEETRALASAQRESIQQCMSQPEMMASLFDL